MSVQMVPSLPKNRFGKILRRILRKVVANQWDDIGDTSTLSDPGVVERIINDFQQLKL
jgi:acetyl-CoA synthetase